jgi:hypothetical protein
MTEVIFSLVKFIFDRVPQLPASEITIINKKFTINNFDSQGPRCIINF